MECSPSDLVLWYLFKHNIPLYKYTEINWIISGKKQEVERDNQVTINSLLREYPTITKTLTALQFWIPPKNSRDSVENKLKRLKKT